MKQVTKKYFILSLVLMCNNTLSFSQPFGYYNGTEGKTGKELKFALHQIINNHVDFSYDYARNIINYADADPDNPNNVILFYLQEPRSASTYGIGGDDINREHVWAKSHGYFGEKRPMDGDAHNLHPADASVNEDRGNKDFDNIQPGGDQHPEALYCYYTDSTWEPGPLTKGQVARTLFYMATRYEGTNGEMNLEVVAHNNTFPKPEHGNLTALLEWNSLYPPSELERRRNERIYQIQRNRNPFIDNPEFANYIWNNESAPDIILKNFSMIPKYPVAGQEVQISMELDGNSAIPDEINLFFGDEYDSMENQSDLNLNQSVYSTTINIPNYQPGEMIYFRIEATNGETGNNIRASYVLPKSSSDLTFTPIIEVQGSGMQSPLINHEVTVSGRVTANFDGTFYLQNGNASGNGICVYNALQTGKIGDSIVVTGIVTEYSTLTELGNISYIYNYDDQHFIEPIEISVSEISEDYEGMLVKIKNVEFTKQGQNIENNNLTYSFSNEEGSGIIFSRHDSRLVGNKLPTGKIDLIGIVSQYNNEYQILPRDINDFALITGNKEIAFYSDFAEIYPNPASSVFKIKSNREILGIKIYDMSGKQMIQRFDYLDEIKIQNFQSGIYIIKIMFSDNQSIFKKIVKN